jgi:choline kinase
MKRALIITVAGTSSRFEKSLNRCNVLKCLYKENTMPSILEVLLEYSQFLSFDKVIIVGGYMFDELKEFIRNHNNIDKYNLVYNPHFINYGSDYSLYLGIIEALKEQCNEIVFAEGDLVVDKNSFVNLYNAQCSVISATKDLITADKSVAFYKNNAGNIRYIYDTEHKQLNITEPFSVIANSAQIWKFCECSALKDIVSCQTEKDFKDTNLIIIEKYFTQIKENDYSIQVFDKWYNCNTVEDYREAMKNL